MIQINIVSRINEDKNFFFDLLFVAQKLLEKNLTGFRLLFIGDILSRTVYQDMIRLIGLFGLSEHVSFTKKSIRFADLPGEVRAGYFFNFTIGNFMGYSGVESLDYGFKTIFYNTDRELDEKTDKSVAMCANIAGLVTLLSSICEDPAGLEEQVKADNLLMKKRFLLDDQDRAFLRQAMNPA
ncbi:hypothetical protein KXD93_21250 [Mucilaginibacter sp. BJC16-A38]|uniref:hypothetical protein n=1 Tax=Mucilaginibacter phenanthrenivorans TaxID=1234842 RepID=UPI002157FE07|nr:hypothetical protein [Mucilaginibacter phenanthrenivorans]MCR8560193.1 hypothetical protein [Mucilaginibacter phenanthrenivorans]